MCTDTGLTCAYRNRKDRSVTGKKKSNADCSSKRNANLECCSKTSFEKNLVLQKKVKSQLLQVIFQPVQQCIL